MNTTMPLEAPATHPQRHADPEETCALTGTDALLEERLDLSEYGLDAEKAVHLWATGAWAGDHPSGYARCGSLQEGHSCAWAEYLGGSHCPQCGKVICAYCRLLDPQFT